MFETKEKTQGASEWLKQELPDFKERKENFTKKERRQLRKRLLELSDQEIINVIGMAEMPLIAYILKIKYEKEIQLVPIEGDIMLSIGECNFANLSYLAVVLHFMRLEDGMMTIEGNISFPATLSGKYSFYISANDERIDSQFEDANLDLKICGQTYEKRTVFKAEIPLEDVTDIRFINEIGELDCACGKINSERFFPVADVIPDQYYAQDGWMFEIKGNCLICKKSTSEEIREKEDIFQKRLRELFPEKADWANRLREHYFEKMKTKQKPVWLFMDRPDRADDNAFVLFKYTQHLSGIESYFVISEQSKDFQKVQQYGRVVPLYSQEHYERALGADFIISSQCNGVVENPFWEHAEMFRDLYHRPKMIFLQHGVIKDDMSPTLNRYNTNFTGFITSTKAEYCSILDYPYYYTEKEVWLTGLPRFDELYNAAEKYILVAPSWRQGLMEQVWDTETENMLWQVKDGFEESDFYKHYEDLINDQTLKDTCKRNGYRIALMFHPLLMPYCRGIDKNEYVEHWDELSYREAFAKASLLITDYSSVAFDFAYLGKPVIYYQFDKEQFFQEHTYQQGYFDYEKDGFGPVYKNKEAVINHLTAFIGQTSFQGNTDNTRLFYGQDNHCEKVVQKIREEQT